MADDIQRQEPLHIQLRNHYAALIAAGTLAAGDRLPSIRTMARRHHVAHNTAARAVELLAAEQLVTTRGRAGTVVTDGGEIGPARLILGPQQRFGPARPVPGERTEVTGAGMVDAPDYVAAILALERVNRHNVTPVYRREQVTYDRADNPIRLEVSWFHPHWAEAVPELAASEPIPSLGGVAWLIAAADPGREIVGGKHGVEARPVKDDGRETTLLGLPSGTVILAAVYTWLDRRNLPVEYGEYVIPQGRVIEHEYTVDPDRVNGLS